jgi:hypothetical protein
MRVISNKPIIYSSANADDTTKEPTKSEKTRMEKLGKVWQTGKGWVQKANETGLTGAVLDFFGLGEYKPANSSGGAPINTTPTLPPIAEKKGLSSTTKLIIGAVVVLLVGSIAYSLVNKNANKGVKLKKARI